MALWIARDNDGTMALFTRKPENRGGTWECFPFDEASIEPAMAPVQLPPGGGPVKVVLITAERLSELKRYEKEAKAYAD